MAITVTQEMADEWNGMVTKLEARFGVLKRLAEDDDWAFIIKSHAIIEVFFTEMLVEILGKKEIACTVEQLPLSDSRIGKLALAKSIGILSSGQRGFIRQFSELRNSLVHNTDNFDFQCSAYYAALSPGKAETWKKVFAEVIGSDLAADWEETMFPRQGRALLWMSLTKMMMLCVKQRMKPMGERWGFEMDENGYATGDKASAVPAA